MCFSPVNIEQHKQVNNDAVPRSMDWFLDKNWWEELIVTTRLPRVWTRNLAIANSVLYYWAITLSPIILMIAAMCIEKLMEKGVIEATKSKEEQVVKYYEQAGDFLLLYLQNR